MNDPITVEVEIQGLREKVWELYNDPEAINVWSTGSDDWQTSGAKNDLRIGGSFSSRMEAKDGSAGFDMGGTYTDVHEFDHIAYTLGDGRKVETVFEDMDDGTRVVTRFEAETVNPRDMQQAGWQHILNNFKKYVESA